MPASSDAAVVQTPAAKRRRVRKSAAETATSDEQFNDDSLIKVAVGFSDESVCAPLQKSGYNLRTRPSHRMALFLDSICADAHQ